MNFSNTVVLGVLMTVVAGCSYVPVEYLPRGYPSRSNQTPTTDLFTSSKPGAGPSESTDTAAPLSGLQIKKSKRGNMESYVVRGQRYFTMDSADGYSARGLASWYGPNFHGRTASNGEIYDMYRLTAAHKTLPLPTYARVTHVENGRSVIVKINDRGPFSGDRVIDLSFAAALRLGMVNDGTGLVDIQALTPEEMAELSGPENKLGIEFYYAEEGEQSAVLPVAEAKPEDTNEMVIKVAAVELDDQPIMPQPINSGSVAVKDEATASIEALFTDLPAPATLEVPAAIVVPALATVVTPASGKATGRIELPVIGRDEWDVPQDKITSEVQQPVPVSVPVIVDANAQRLTPAPAAVQLVKLPSAEDRLSYYIQAGVYADVQDAERVAVDAVLAAPGEEVHVKPLKDSHMYRITVGPIVSSAHSEKVSKLLASAGIDTFTVKVK